MRLSCGAQAEGNGLNTIKIAAIDLIVRPAHVALLLLPLVTGCAAIGPAPPITPLPAVLAPQPPEAPLPSVAAPAVSIPQPSSTVTTASAAPAAAATERKPAARATQTPADAAPAPAAPAPLSAATVAKPAPRPVAAAPAPAAPPSLDLNGLKEQLKETKAIGVFTKLSLKNQVDDLLQQFRDHYQGRAKNTMAQLRRSYDLLLMKVLSLIQDADERLASAIVASREAIWGLLSDQRKFSTLQV